MLHVRQPCDLRQLNTRLREVAGADAPVINEAFGLLDPTKTTRLAQLIQSGAWTDAALALIDLELPLWQMRRLAYDDGEWHCGLSRERELPDWLDQSVEGRHADLALAILCAFVEARRVSGPEVRSLADAKGTTRDLYETLPVDNIV